MPSGSPSSSTSTIAPASAGNAYDALGRTCSIDARSSSSSARGRCPLRMIALTARPADTASGITAMNVPTPSGRPTRRNVISLVTPNVPSLPTNSAVRS